MPTAKDLVIRQIDRRAADAIVKRLHYSGKVVNNSQIHLGVFLDNRLEGAMQLGPSLDKRKIQGLVSGTLWHEFIELNRMAFSEALPRNSESRALAVAMRILRKHAPQIKWVVSFADAAQCGDGTIYRAAGFVLTGVNPNVEMVRMPTGEVVHRVTFCCKSSELAKKYSSALGGRSAGMAEIIRVTGGERIQGHQIRYIYFIDPSYRARLTVPELPYSAISEMGAGMYRGQKRGPGEIDNAPGSNRETGGASPTGPLSEVALVD